MKALSTFADTSDVDEIKRDVENQIRGLLKNLGLVIGRAKMNVFELPLTSGQTKSLPGRGGGEIALGFAMLERAKRASHIESTSVTLRHHAEGMFPTAERTLDPARMFEESLTPRPELENKLDPKATWASHSYCLAKWR